MEFPAAHPAVIGSITTPDGLGLLAEAKSTADAIEVRVDALLGQGATPDGIETALKKRRQPVLLTLRISEEGGRISWEQFDRRELYRRLLPQVEAIDVELATVRDLDPLLTEALDAQKTVVLSAHALDRPPPSAQYGRWLREHDTHDAKTILKVAAHIDSWRDLQRLAAMLINNPEKQIAVMGLGPHAAQSRSVLAALGSRLIYGWLDEPAAPGQPSAAEARKIVDELPPRDSSS
jgi:3-dehydroquinate dehydratase-1